MLTIPILLPILGGLPLFFLKEEKSRRALSMALTLASGLLALFLCLRGGESLTLLQIASGLSITLGIDGLSRFFLCLVSFIWPLALWFSFPYLEHAGGQSRFYGFFVMSLGVLFGLGLSANLLTFYFFYELMTLITLPLVIHDRTKEALKAGLKYLGYSVFGAGLALFGFFFLGQYGLTTSFTAGGVLDPAKLPGHETLLAAVYLIMMVGFGAKAGLLPLQSWLTSAHPVAPAPASAILSGLITKGGVLAIIRVTFFLFGPVFLQGSFAQATLLILSLATVFAGSMLAFKEKVLKKRLAYSTVSQVSYALFGIFLLTPGGLSGALLQVVFHALAKDLLFLSAGAMIYRTGYTRVEQLGGIGKVMPLTLACFLFGALSLVGIPPFGGFVSKWELAVSALQAPVDVFSVLGPVVLLLSALLTAGYLFPLGIGGFFGGAKGEGEPALARAEAPVSMLVPMGILAVLCLALGMFPGGLSHAFSQITGPLF